MPTPAILRDKQREIDFHPQAPIIGISRSTEDLSHSYNRFKRSFLRNSSTLENISLPKPSIITLNDWNSLNTVLAKIQNLSSWAENWHDLDSLAPHSETIVFAQQWISEFFKMLNNEGLGWLEPNITVGSDADIVFEWWYTIKQLVIYIKAGEPIMYLKVWGPDTSSEMTDGYLNNIYETFSLWEWLKSDK